MPFTASHAALVLPLRWTGLPISALVVGSVAPDLPYYSPGGWGTERVVTHSLQGILTIDLVLGAAAWAVWHGLLAAWLLHVAPTAVRRRVVGRVTLGLRPRVRGAADLVRVAAAIGIGALTHVTIDTFTHEGGWGVSLIGALEGTWWGIPGYWWLQLVTSIAGLGALAAWALSWWRRNPPGPGEVTAGGADGREQVWTGLLLAAVAAVVGTGILLGDEERPVTLFWGVTGVLGAALTTMLVLAALHRWRQRTGRAMAGTLT